MKQYKKWLLNASMSKKFIPTQLIILILVIIIGCISVGSVYTVNTLSKKVFTENVQNTEMLNEITKTMYVCRVLGRDILLQPDIALRQILYTSYIDAFKKLDLEMDKFAKRLTGEKLTIFNNIIVNKGIYKDSMILSADLKNKGSNFNEALEALTRVTPIANEFFGSIDQFLTDEKQLMSEVLDKNDDTVIFVIALDVLINSLVAILLFIVIKALEKTMCKSLISLEQSVSKIANTGNMNINIPEHLFTKDEIGLIAIAMNKLKNMLLEYSYSDLLTGGYNSTAYYKEIELIFERKQDYDSQIEFWCIIFDLNNLKLINDQFGHNEGDTAIRDAHTIMSNSFSKYGKTFRVGGDEFVSILSNCSKKEIEIGIDKMKLKIKEKVKTTEYDFSIALGYGEFKGKTKEEFKEYFKVVDKKMYQDKILTKKNK